MWIWLHMHIHMHLQICIMCILCICALYAYTHSFIIILPRKCWHNNTIYNYTHAYVINIQLAHLIWSDEDSLVSSFWCVFFDVVVVVFGFTSWFGKKITIYYDQRKLNSATWLQFKPIMHYQHTFKSWIHRYHKIRVWAQIIWVSSSLQNSKQSNPTMKIHVFSLHGIAVPQE